MKVRIIAVLLILALLLTSFAAADSPADTRTTTNLRLVTANIWGDYFGNPVSEREDAFLDAFLKYEADVIGMQECTSGWHASKLFSGLQENNYAMLNKFKGVGHNYVPIFYRSDRFELVDSGFQYYMKVPNDRSKAFTWAVLKSIENGQVFGVVNTHFWWKSGAEHDAIRMINSEQLVQRMLAIHDEYNCPVFAFGDLNCTTYAAPFTYFNENNIIRLRDIAQSFSKKSSHHGDPVRGEDGLYHGKVSKNPEVKAIDHIIGLQGDFDYEVTTYQLILDQPVLDASDHSPVYADIILYGETAQ